MEARSSCCRNLFAVQKFFHQGIVVLGDVFDRLFPMLLVIRLIQRRKLERGGNVRTGREKIRVPQLGDIKDFKFRAQGFLEPDNRLFFQEIDDANEKIFLADGALNRHGMRGQTVAHRFDGVLEIRTGFVHLVDERQPRNVIFVRLAPYGFRLRLHARVRVENRDRAVQHAQRALDFHGEVHVAGRVNNVDQKILVPALPTGRGRGGRDRDAALALLLHPVHRGGAFIDRADLVRHARIKQDAFRRSRLSGVDVRHDADITCFRELCLACHC